MNPNIVRYLVTLTLSMIAAVVLGSVLGSGDYDRLFLLSYALLGIYVVTTPGFVPLIALGLLNPFILPIPYVHAVPFMLMILGVCLLKLFLQNAVSRRHRENYYHCFTLSIAAFFGWVILRYGMNPVLPNLSGFGENVTGFRSYLQYGLCFALVLLLPLFVPKREDVVRLLRWMGGISLFFILFFTPFIFTKSSVAALWLSRFGLFVGFFDNGWLRFVSLPFFGLTLLSLALLPNLMPGSARKRAFLGVLGVSAILMGGSRSTVLMAIPIVLTVALLGRRTLIFTALIVGIGFSLVAFNYIGERVNVHGGVGFLRVLSLTSRRIAEETDAASTMEWRMVRWNRAIYEIKAHPYFGKGYGGLENAWVFSDRGQLQEALVEVDLVSGGIHNGFLAGAFSLGIPAVVLFLIAFVGQMIRSAAQSLRYSTADPLYSELHTFICANLAGLLAAIYVGTDLNGLIIWFYLTLGVLITRLKHPVSATEGTSPVALRSRPLGSEAFNRIRAIPPSRCGGGGPQRA